MSNRHNNERCRIPFCSECLANIKKVKEKADDIANNHPHPKPVNIPAYNNVPRWLVLQGEIDFRLFLLKTLQGDNAKRQPLERLIDETTGYDKQVLADAEELIAELRWLKDEYNKEVA